ncbi:MAG: 3-dehydroquinate synthase [Microscillaceae bacterium]|nr:3-dehydroquinate synthase [Microscillaceae bacterium]MDW8460289.1 3-dehydroquinate synthase [Cytophagales bacterium]
MGKKQDFLAMESNFFLGQDSFHFLANWLKLQKYSQVVVLVDRNTKQFCYPLIKDFLPENHFLIEIPAGELHKNLQTCHQIWAKLTTWAIDRKALLVNLGGGVLCDIGGFCAATYKRGIDFVHIPTTLLAQVDACFGGKLGIDFQGFKNQIGVFALPKHVLVNPTFLHTLPKRELYAGFAEVIKHSLIADAEHFQFLVTLERQFSTHLHEIVYHSIKIKNQIVEQDFKEQHLRKTLNFGHTVGHAIESFLLQFPERAILHGEAIVVGMLCEAWLAMKRNLLPKTDFEQIWAYLTHIYPQKIVFSPEEVSEIAKLCLQDKKNTHRQILLATLEQIGKAVFDVPVTLGEIEQALYFYLKNL